jgi:hypothetical protein
LPHEVPDGTEICGVTGELDLPLHRWWEAGTSLFYTQDHPAGRSIEQVRGDFAGGGP